MDFKVLAPDYKDEYLTKVKRLLRIPSVFEEDSNYPFGKKIDDALKEMLAIGREDGFQVKNLSGYAGHIEWGEGEQILGILGHLDVVPAGDGWSSAPFEPVIKGGNLYGRGAQDDKGPVMAAYIAMKLLKDQGFEPNKRIRLILGTDEERDWQGIDYYFKQEEMPSFGFSPDAAFPVIHAEKGLIDGYMELPVLNQSRDRQIQIIRIEGGDRLNMVPDKAIAILRTDNHDLVEQKFTSYLTAKELDGKCYLDNDRMMVEVHGKGAHASKPSQGVNAIIELFRFLTGLPLSEEAYEWFSQLAEILGDDSGENLGIKHHDDVSGSLTMNLGSFQLSETGLVAGLNIRYPVTVESEALLHKIQEQATRWKGTYKVYDHLRPLYIDEDHDGVSTLLNIYNHHTGDRTKAEAIGGATYARALKAGVAYGAMFPDSPDTAHQADEYVRIQDMMAAVAIYAEAIYQLTK
ncbi:dipeptidase PepV [Thalassobacillus sp. B23F22_16]|uniref:dipeptidase PepV n=1 Tax=Thalassobacillus sp. B23F22_16 TaxID=3459513 RepID=UPI00373F994D